MVHSLNGRWSLRGGTYKNVPASVPGSVHTALLEANIIPDPYVRTQEEEALWVGSVEWTFSRMFLISDDMLQNDRVLLRCDGLDTLATLLVNGRHLATTNNMFRRYELDIKPLLQSGENAIAITFAAPVPAARRRNDARYLHNWGVVIEDNPTAHNNHVYKLPGVNHLRKAQYSFGWDWGPMVPTSGIWRDIALVGYSEARLDSVYVAQTHQENRVRLDVSIDVERIADGPLGVRATVLLDGKKVARGETAVSTSTTIALDVSSPQLWWPNGMGNQPLYDVTITLHNQSGIVLDEWHKKIGLRTLRLVRQPDDWGESFYFEANGVPFFAKGANWIPADAFLDWLGADDYERLIHDSALANMNMLRVWGGGVYEPDLFYELCDAYGICVWQDFMFACAMYPTFDDAWMASVEQEAIDQIRRLRHHACLALWCGNNELEQGLVGPEETETTMSWAAYGHLFDSLLPRLVLQHDPQTDYWPASPHTPVGDRHDFNAPDSGDAHIWDVWHGLEPFEFYRTCLHRFNSEFGFQSFPEPKTVAEYTQPQDRNITSYVMEHHQRSLNGNARIMHYMLDWFRFPTSFEGVLWLSQILQGMAIKYAVEHWRRTMPRGMGTLYWQLNDCWPVASWSSIDYYGHWKALHYMAQRFFATLLVSGVENIAEGTVELHLTSDLTEPVEGELVWTLLTAQGELVANGRLPSTASPLANSHIATLNLSDQLAEQSPRNLLLFVDFESEGESFTSNLVLFARPKHLELQPPKISVEIKEDDGLFTAMLTSDAIALWVWLESGDLEVRFSDGFFHMRPGQPVEVGLAAEEGVTLDMLKTAVAARSLTDTYTLAS